MPTILGVVERAAVGLPQPGQRRKFTVTPAAVALYKIGVRELAAVVGVRSATPAR
ncbi:MAG TPA: hypothetical protein VFX70_08295 [Mycobacteriales bacterium]|nr:hypothetical protein [Mycobacteriales bacterium]